MSSKKAKKKAEKPITPETVKSYSLDEVEDKHIGEKGTYKRDAYEKELLEDVALQNTQNNFDNAEWTWDDTTTGPGPTKAKAPAPDKEHGKELNLALSHLAKQGELLLLTASQVLTEPALDLITKSNDRIIISYPGKDNDFLIAEMAKRYFVLQRLDTDYLRKAVRLSKQSHLYKTILVFDKR